MKRKIHMAMLLFTLIIGVYCTPIIAYAEEAEAADKTDLIANEEERAPSQPVGEDGLIPVYAEDLKEGAYSIEVKSSSSMFRIVKAKLTVADGSMTAVITLGGKGYLKLYMGTGEQAVEAGEEEYAAYEEDDEGAYTYTVSVEALNQELECTGFSKRKEKWYDHQILFQADSLPKEALLKQISPVSMDVEDGSYTMEVDLEGGTGKASVESPAQITVSGQTAVASLQWSSPNYDYMIVNGKKYFPVNTEGNSVFEVPIWALDEGMEVIADTTAMSTPHEITYLLTFRSDTLRAETDKIPASAICLITVVCAAGICIVILLFKKMRTSYE